ncbi:MAG: hypothetical protein ACKOEE_08605 [Tagaea sp.]|nr:hypothetical protein [Azospirillum sp.]MCA3268317.1 hypothetical protein [Azospirillum sp.]MCZ8123883.1 hypothetical protein [Magnetospirillum sp.]
MAGSISQAAAPVIDFRNQKTAALLDVSQQYSQRTETEVLRGVAQGNEIASNSTAVLQGRGGRVDIVA